MEFTLDYALISPDCAEALVDNRSIGYWVVAIRDIDEDRFAIVVAPIDEDIFVTDLEGLKALLNPYLFRG